MRGLRRTQIPDTFCMIDVMTFLKGEVGGWFNNVTYLNLAHPSYFVSANVKAICSNGSCPFFLFSAFASSTSEEEGSETFLTCFNAYL